jgi:type I restriction enzyme S subunit
MRELILGQSLDALIDHRGKTPAKMGTEFTSSGVPVASAVLVKDGRLELSAARYVSLETHERWMPVPTRAGDVLLTSEAPLGRVARVPDDSPIVLGQRLFALRGRPGVLDSGYLFYALQTSDMQTALIGRSTGTTVFGIRQSALRQLRISAPDYMEQKLIAEVLGALDDKIAANAVTVQAAQTVMLAVARRATGRTALGSLAVQRTTSLKPDAFDGQIDHYSLPAFDTDALPERAARDSVQSNKFLLRGPSVLIAKLNPRIPRIWNIPALGSRMSVASTEFVVLEPVDCSTSALWAAVSQPEFSTQLQSKVAGTSGSHQRVRPAEMLTLDVLDPRTLSPTDSALVDDLGRSVALIRAESARLAATRDELLPLLMSGRLAVRAVEAVTEAVT